MKKIHLRGVVLAVLVASGPAFVGSAAFAGGTLSVGKADANASPILPVNVADKLGLFKKHGLDVTIADFTGGSKLSQAMVAGSIDIGVGAGTEMAFVAKGRADHRRLRRCTAHPLHRHRRAVGFADPHDRPAQGQEDRHLERRLAHRLAGARARASRGMGAGRRDAGRDRQRRSRRPRRLPHQCDRRRHFRDLEHLQLGREEGGTAARFRSRNTSAISPPARSTRRSI